MLVLQVVHPLAQVAQPLRQHLEDARLLAAASSASSASSASAAAASASASAASASSSSASSSRGGGATPMSIGSDADVVG